MCLIKDLKWTDKLIKNLKEKEFFKNLTPQEHVYYTNLINNNPKLIYSRDERVAEILKEGYFY